MYYKRTAELLLQIQCRSRVHYVSICCGKMQKIKIVCIMPNRSWTVGEIRLTEPLKALCQKHSEIECHFTAVFDVSVQDLEGANIVIFQRIATPFAERAAQKLTAMGVPYIYEIDDLLWDVPQGLLSSSAWNRNKERLFFLLKNARAVTTTTPQIAEKLREFNSDVRVIPNVLRLPAKRNFSFDSRAKLILSATDRIYIAPAAEALKKLQDLYSTEIIAIGPVAEDLRAKGIKVSEYPVMDLEKYSAFLASLDNVIGLCPLDDSAFSRCKSSVKYQSYSLAGIPVLASCREPYSGAIRHGHSGYLVPSDSAEAWFEALQLHLNEPERLEEYVKKALADLENAADTGALWYTLFQEIHQNSPAAVHDFKMPSSWDWGYFRYFFSLEKYAALFRLIRQYGIGKIFQLLRKGM